MFRSTSSLAFPRGASCSPSGVPAKCRATHSAWPRRPAQRGADSQIWLAAHRPQGYEDGREDSLALSVPERIVGALSTAHADKDTLLDDNAAADSAAAHAK